MSTYRDSFGGNCTRALFAGALSAALLAGGCVGPFRGLASRCGDGNNSCGEPCAPPASCCDEPICGHCGVPIDLALVPQGVCCVPQVACGHLHGVFHMPCKHCGHLLHFCDHSDYVGPIEPAPHPRFHPVPTHPVYAHGLPWAE